MVRECRPGRAGPLSGWQQVIDADGAAGVVRIKTVTFAANGCALDWVLTARKGAASKRRSRFRRVVADARGRRGANAPDRRRAAPASAPPAGPDGGGWCAVSAPSRAAATGSAGWATACSKSSIAWASSRCWRGSRCARRCGPDSVARAAATDRGIGPAPARSCDHGALHRMVWRSRPASRWPLRRQAVRRAVVASRSRASSDGADRADGGGRVGAGITAEIGAMQVTEQVDAIRSMGADPVQKLVLRACSRRRSRFRVDGARRRAGRARRDDAVVEPVRDRSELLPADDHQHVTVGDMFSGIAKTFVFGWLIAMVGCFMALQTPGHGRRRTRDDARGGRGVDRRARHRFLPTQLLVIL